MLRTLFIALSESKSLRRFAERSRAGQRMSGRFVAGETIESALQSTREINDLGMTVSLDNLGENVTDAAEARHSAELYRQLLNEIAARKLDANVSLKLTHMGLDVDPALAEQITGGLVDQAASLNNFVRVDMEGSEYTDRTLELVRSLHKDENKRGAVGTVIQSYLYRSEKDVRQLCEEGIRVRLCKGAYREPEEIAFQKKSDVDANFVLLTRILLESDVYHGIATHDEKMIDATIDFARSRGIPADHFEFQMLYGIRRDLQQKLVADGWNMRVYLPFGTEWYPYFMRRLAERPANVLFILKNMFRR